MNDKLFQWWRRFEFLAGKYILFVLARCVHWLPLGVAMRLGRALGWLAPRISRRHLRRIATDAMQFLGEGADPQEATRIAYGFYRHAGESLIEFLRLAYMTEDEVHQLVRLEGAERLDVALAQGKGVICVSGHIGNFELLSAVMGLSKYPPSDVARQQKDTQLTELFRRVRERFGLRLIDMDDVRGCLRTLKRNELLGLLSDGNARVPGCFVNFFGRPAATFIGAAYFNHATGAPMIPIFIERLPDNTHITRVGIEIPPVQTGDKKKDLLLTTIRIQHVIEHEIRRRPENWYWLVQRWKTRPESIPNPERIPMEHRDLTPEEVADALDFPHEVEPGVMDESHRGVMVER
ncbi:MAG: lysophospholipid acyltransferase family protein [Armatimonadota bacterium]